MSRQQIIKHPQILHCKIDDTSHATHHKFIHHLRKLKVTQQQYYDTWLITDALEKVCNTCKQPTEFISVKYGYKPFCSHHCAINSPVTRAKRRHNTKQALLQKYGVENPSQISGWREKCKTTSIQRYGDPHYVNPEKAKKTHIEKYGKFFTGTTEYKKKYTSTVKNRYGVNHHTQSVLVKDKIKTTNIKKYGVESYLSIEAKTKSSVQDKMEKFYSYIDEYCTVHNLQHSIDKEQFFEDSKNRTFILQCRTCALEFSVNWLNSQRTPRCPNCFRPHYVSKWELELKNFIEYDLGIPIEKNVRFYDKNVLYEADILLEEYKLIVECDGIYWHGEHNGKKSANYHINKNKFFSDKGYTVIHILDYEWTHKNDIVKSRLKSKLGKIDNKIGARKLRTTEISSKDARKFIEENHIKGFVSAKYHVALVDDAGQIYAVLSASTRGRMGISGPGTAEIIRFCNKKDWNVMGSFSKLFQFLLTDVAPDLQKKKIVSYADRRWSENVRAYEYCNFNKKRYTSPSYWYTKSGKIYHRTQFMKHLLKSKLQKFNENMTEYENMILNGYDRYWDCGEVVYEYN
jgi:flavodoxin